MTLTLVQQVFWAYSVIKHSQNFIFSFTSDIEYMADLLLQISVI